MVKKIEIKRRMRKLCCEENKSQDNDLDKEGNRSHKGKLTLKNGEKSSQKAKIPLYKGERAARQIVRKAGSYKS